MNNVVDQLVLPAERCAQQRWLAAVLAGEVTPFSFRVGEQASDAWLRTCKREIETESLDECRIAHRMSFRDTSSGLSLAWVAIEYTDYPTLEWTVYLRNGGSEASALFADLQGLDALLPAEPPKDARVVLHHHVGSPCTQYDYRPLEMPLDSGRELSIATSGGRSSNSDWPYFHLDAGATGTLIAVGWPGQWATRWERGSQGVRVRAGQELTRFRLLPGESARTPLIALQFRAGAGAAERMRAQNVFRRWMWEHNLPRPGGSALGPQIAACSSHQYGEMVRADEASQVLFIDRYLDQGLKLDYWWMDAGWYPCGNWPETGTWEVDRKRFPRGLRPITDHAHARGLRSIVWFEPERVAPGTWLDTQHPEWLLGTEGGNRLLNLGHPEALAWLTEHVDGLIVSEGIDLYRQDFNIDPLPFWRAHDAPDRQGMTEMAHVQGLLAFWDELRRRHPDLPIDTCASGGRRNDLEVLRRAVPLLRSDYIFEPVGQQCHTYGIASWLPFYGTGVISEDPYVVRSAFCPHLIACWDVRRDDLAYDTLRTLLGEWRAIAPSLLADYYPLTPYSFQNDVWMAFQFHRPETQEGAVLAFRRANCRDPSITLPLSALDDTGRYAILDLGAGSERVALGSELLGTGLTITLDGSPAAAVIAYTRIPG